MTGSAAAGPGDDAAAPLEPGRPVDRVLTVGETHAYRLALPAGRYLHIAIEQSHLDVVARLVSSDGSVLAEVDNSADREEPLALSAIASRDETALLELRLRSSTAPAGPYRLALETLREPRPEDERRIAAERLLSEADHLAAQGSAAAMKEALGRYDRLVAEWRGLGDRRAEADALARMGDVQSALGDTRPALASAEQALAISRALGDPRGEAVALTQAGLAHSELGEQRQGIQLLESALPLRRAAHDPRGEAEVQNDIAVALGGLGALPEAIERYTEALERARDAREPLLEATILKNRAIDHESLGEMERALTDLQDSLAAFRILKNRHQEGVTQYNIGNTLLHMGEERGALDRYALALTLLREAGDRRFEAFTLNHMGLAELAAKRLDQALEPLESALELLRASGDRRNEAMVLADIGLAHLERGEAREALGRLREALPLVQASGDRVHEAMTLAMLARAEQATGDLGTARARIEESLNLTEALRSSIPGLGERTSYMAQASARYGLLVDILMSLHAQHPDQNWDAKALLASERGRARGLIELLAEAHVDIREGVPTALLDQEKDIEGRIEKARQAQQRVQRGTGTPQEIEAARHAMESLLVEHEDASGRLRAASPRYAALVEPQPLTIREIQEQVLGPDTLLLEYALGEERSFLYAVTPTTFTSHQLPGRATVETATRAVYTSWSTANADAQEQGHSARALSRMLLGPVAAELGRKRIVIVADGALQYLPFSALPTPAAPGATADVPLVADHEIVTLPSASTLAVLRRELAGRAPAPRSVAVLADPVFDSDDPRVGLPRSGRASSAGTASSADLARSAKEFGILQFDRLRASRREAAEITRLAPQPNLEALDFKASRQTATSPELGQYRIVHFASHGLLNSRHPELSGIVLSLVDEKGQPMDGFFQARDIYSLKLGADLVVLSACQTALGKEVRGEGFLGLARGFMYAGAPRVVASLWRVSDRATAELMRRFYSAMLKDGLPPAAALRSAQQAIRREPGWTSPYYWAAFTLQGEWK